MGNFTQKDLQTVDRAIATGELRVRYEDSEVTYRSMDDLLKAKRVIEASLGVSDTSFAVGVYNRG